MDGFQTSFVAFDEEPGVPLVRGLPIQAPPIAVDLDGTLLRGDSLHEGLALLLLRKPWAIFALLLALLAGKAAFKRFVAERTMPCGEAPLHSELLAYLREQKALGRRIGLFSAADQSIVDAFASRIGIFDVARGSDGRRNLSGAAKLAAIRQIFGDLFVYAGDADVDLPIWRHCGAAVLVGRTGRLRAKLGAGVEVEREFELRSASIGCWLRALRLHQWTKNALVFVPGLLALPTLTLADGANFLLAFLLLGLVASATYLVNDLVDLAADRAHRSKRLRPLASGAIPLAHAAAAILAMALLATGLAALLPGAILQPLFLYLGATLAYSFHIKRVPVLDVLCLGVLFTLRIHAGTTLMPGPAPYWLFAFSMFFFTSLALVKRYTELLAAGGKALPGRGYAAGDLPFVLSAGLSSGMASLLVFLIYLGEQHFNRELFQQPQWLGVAGVLLAYWLLRVWLLATRDQMHDDPVLFAVKDRASLFMGVLVGTALLLAW